MGLFTDTELDYLRGQRLGRIATAGGDCSPHVVPVGFRVATDGEAIEIGGHGMGRSKKWRDLQANSRVAFVVDDPGPASAWMPRGIEIRGRAELNDEGGHERFGANRDNVWIRVVPERIVSWGINGPASSEAGRSARSVGK